MKHAPGCGRAMRLALALGLLGAASLLTGCESSGKGLAAESMVAGRVMAAPRPGGPVPSPPAERSIIRTGWVEVTVEDVPAATARVEALVEGEKGYVESSQISEERTATIRFRIPADSLDAALDRIAALGREKSRRVSAMDVTDQVADLEAALRNKRALRDRLRTLLDRATKVEDVLRIEVELGRLQTDIDQMEGQLERMRKQVALSTVTVELVRERVLGPFGYVGQGLAWLFEKAFVIRD